MGDKKDQVRVVATGGGWLGRGTGSVNTTLETMLAEARSEVLVTAYTIGTGADSLLDALEQCAQRGVKVTVVVNRFPLQPAGVRDRLLQVANSHPWFRVFDFSSPSPDEELHAKVVVADRQRALVGSANLSRHGLVLNHELAVLISGPTADDIARTVERLLMDQRLVHQVDLEDPGEGGLTQDGE